MLGTPLYSGRGRQLPPYQAFRGVAGGTVVLQADPSILRLQVRPKPGYSGPGNDPVPIRCRRASWSRVSPCCRACPSPSRSSILSSSLSSSLQPVFGQVGVWLGDRVSVLPCVLQSQSRFQSQSCVPPLLSCAVVLLHRGSSVAVARRRHRISPRTAVPRGFRGELCSAAFC